MKQERRSVKRYEIYLYDFGRNEGSIQSGLRPVLVIQDDRFNEASSTTIIEEQVCIVCNDEGKLNGMQPCRAVYGDEHQLMDIVFGPFFICDCSGENFGSLSPKQIEKYTEMFRQPEHFYRKNGEIIAVPYEPRPQGLDR